MRSPHGNYAPGPDSRKVRPGAGFGEIPGPYINVGASGVHYLVATIGSEQRSSALVGFPLMRGSEGAGEGVRQSHFAALRAPRQQLVNSSSTARQLPPP